MDTQKLDQTYIANTYARFPVTIVKGKGSLVWDDTGKEYIDLSTGIAVDIFGVADEEWVAWVIYCVMTYWLELLLEWSQRKPIHFQHTKRVVERG